MKARDLAEILLRFPDKEVMIKKYIISADDYYIEIDCGKYKIVPLSISDCLNDGNWYIINDNIFIDGE